MVKSYINLQDSQDRIVIGWPEPAPSGFKRLYKRLRRELLPKAGLLWWKRFLPRHFTRRGRALYGYQRRSQGYVKRKKRTWAGRDLPLVWSGATRHAALSNTPGLKVTTRGLDVKLRGLPRYIWYNVLSQKGRNMPDMVKELTTTNEQEAAVLAKAMETEFYREVNKAQAKRKGK